MKPTATFIFLFILAAIFASCNSNSVGPPSEKYITGIVRDSAGNPVAGAFLNIGYRLRDEQTGGTIGGELNGPSPDTSYVTVRLGFEVQVKSHAHVVIENYIHQYIKTISDDTVEAGMYEIQFTIKDSLGRTLYSDMYFYQVTLVPLDNPQHAVTFTNKFFLLIPQHLSKNPSPFLRTDDQGRFAIPLSRLPVEDTLFASTNGSPDTLLFEDTHRLYAFTTTRYGSTDVSTSNLVDHTIILTNAK
ncbi:MAG: hypothetical protein ABSF91_01535 [Bacteroidota bacterium]|jgi:hypothetical protein